MAAIVSAGFHKTHMTIAAREAADRGLLALAITGAYPTARARWLLRRAGLSRRGRTARLLERGEGIPEDRLAVLLAPELLDEALRPLARLPALHSPASVACWRLYGRLAARALRSAPGARVYHFRAGFGHASVERARRAGLATLCDHALAHPAALTGLVPAAYSRAIQADLDRADAVLVNSDYVRRTFLERNWPPDRVHVAYLGVDENFMRALPAPSPRPAGGPLRLLFAGRFDRRKGADVLVEALAGLDEDWRLTVAGVVVPESRNAHGAFLADPRVRVAGVLRRPELAREMAATPVFVFPSRAEGSARVVFEALAAGAYVVTTPSAGSIVEDGVHGALIAADDPAALRGALAAAAADPQRVAAVGRRNRDLVAASYRQRHYGDALARLYAGLAR